MHRNYVPRSVRVRLWARFWKGKRRCGAVRCEFKALEHVVGFLDTRSSAVMQSMRFHGLSTV